MTSPLQIDFPGGGSAAAMEVTDVDDLASAISTLGLRPPQPTVVVVGGAGGLDEADAEHGAADDHHRQAAAPRIEGFRDVHPDLSAHSHRI